MIISWNLCMINTQTHTVPYTVFIIRELNRISKTKNQKNIFQTEREKKIHSLSKKEELKSTRS